MRGGRRGRRLTLGILYWLLVLLVSLALALALVLFFEARDASQLEVSRWMGSPVASAGSSEASRAKTTIRWAAL